MRILSAIFNSLFGTAQKVTAQIVIAIPTSLSVAYVGQLVLPAPPVAEARIESPAPAGIEKPLIKTAVRAAEPVGFASRTIDFAERDCSAGCEVATLKVAEAAPMEPEFDPALPETPAAADTPPSSPKTIVGAALTRIGATFGFLGGAGPSAQVH
jgi:hypothetical protein